ncbi:hypothetical protein [Streptomyces minutiscleroticus]|uniref:hypothetical protein n=1 Tax=Streptomyces minutiscleroticus TaxID=68238 RepID=UPI00331DFCF1
MEADAVLLVVELVSPGIETMDRKVKPLLYAEAAIPHLWRLGFEPARGSSSASWTAAGTSRRPPPSRARRPASRRRSPSTSTRPA